MSVKWELVTAEEIHAVLRIRQWEPEAVDAAGVPLGAVRDRECFDAARGVAALVAERLAEHDRDVRRAALERAEEIAMSWYEGIKTAFPDNLVWSKAAHGTALEIRALMTREEETR